MPQTYHLEPSVDTSHAYFSPERAPILTIDPGDSVIYRTLESGWRVEPLKGGTYQQVTRFSGYDAEVHGRGHALVGPVAVRGAKPGMTLAVHINAVIPASWGNTLAGGWSSAVNKRYNIEDRGIAHAWTMNPDTMTAVNHLGHTVTLRPFMGVMGLPPAEPGRHPTAPPRVTGGNIDCKELIAGTTLYLPIAVEGALFSTGDGHAVQGDGEVSITAIECGMEKVDLTFDLRDDFPISVPHAHTQNGWLTMGFGDNLDDATYMALEAMFALMQKQYKLERLDAIALASLTVDLHVTQIVNGVVGVHAILPHGAIR
jgi:acetamidase/formamidase